MQPPSHHTFQYPKVTPMGTPSAPPKPAPASDAGKGAQRPS
jgi:hypothetical protein